MPRQWRVVAEGGQNTVIPAGYNDYRIRLYCNVSAPSTQSNTVLRLSNKSGAAYLTGVRSYGTTLDTGTFTIPSGGNAIAYLTESNSVSLSIFATIELHVREGTNSIVGFVNSSGVGKDWYIASKLDFALPSLNNLGDLSVTRTGSTVSNVEFIIEALV